jgi:excisionase family DNA binding protein
MPTKRKAHPHAPQLYRVKDVAQVLGCSQALVAQWIRAGRLKALRLGDHTTRVERRDLLAFLKAHPYRPNPVAPSMQAAREAQAKQWAEAHGFSQAETQGAQWTAA